MNSFLQALVDFLSLSGCLWALFALYYSIRVQFFIVNRYEKETDLLNTIYFREHATFTKILPGFISSPMYVAHLISFIWAWRYCRTKKPYRDIGKKEEVLKYFSNKEIRRIKWLALALVIVFFHIVIVYIVDLFWPNSFA